MTRTKLTLEVGPPLSPCPHLSTVARGKRRKRPATAGFYRWERWMRGNLPAASLSLVR
uniref:Uncharacterized protein n=1 Tax=Setaria italica TaxID=4555 RepID=K3Z232_SETIT